MTKLMPIVRHRFV